MRLLYTLLINQVVFHIAISVEICIFPRTDRDTIGFTKSHGASELIIPSHRSFNAISATEMSLKNPRERRRCRKSEGGGGGLDHWKTNVGIHTVSRSTWLTVRDKEARVTTWSVILNESILLCVNYIFYRDHARVETAWSECPRPVHGSQSTSPTPVPFPRHVSNYATFASNAARCDLA